MIPKINDNLNRSHINTFTESVLGNCTSVSIDSEVFTLELKTTSSGDGWRGNWIRFNTFNGSSYLCTLPYVYLKNSNDPTKTDEMSPIITTCKTQSNI